MYEENNNQVLNSNQDVELNLHYHEEEDDAKKHNIKLPEGHVSKKNWKLCFFLFFLIGGIALAGVLVYILN